MTAERLGEATDRELMVRVQADDAQAFGALYDRLAPRALRLASGLCPSGDQAQDAVQDGFLSMWRGRAGYRPESGEVHSWAFSIVHNRAIDHQRRNRRHDGRRDGLEGVVEGLRAPGDLEADAVVADDAGRLRALLTGLPAAQREVIALAYFGELSHTEIAERLELPVGTVKGRMRLGLLKLRERLAA